MLFISGNRERRGFQQLVQRDAQRTATAAQVTVLERMSTSTVFYLSRVRFKRSENRTEASATFGTDQIEDNANIVMRLFSQPALFVSYRI